MHVLPAEIHEQLVSAYGALASISYRPAAPSDGFGNLTVRMADIKSEASNYANRWWQEEEQGQFRVGVPDFKCRRALVFIIEAARLCCSQPEPLALKLLELAEQELRATMHHS